MKDIIYETYPTTQAFHDSKAFVRGLLGPIGSGKSVACCWEIFRLANAQEPDEQGIRRTRWAIIRNTYRELIDTTMKTWFEWFPEASGKFLKTESRFTMTTALPDGTTVEMEILFRALDKPQDVKKLLSLELTGAWVNEAREIPRQIIDMLQGRTGRFPPERTGGPTWFGIIMDTNPPDDDHWWYKIFEEQRPDNWELFHQPSALSSEAENLKKLPSTYYSNMMQGKEPEWINVYVKGLYGFTSTGKPVYSMFNSEIHVDRNIKFNDRLAVHLGIDFGLTPAAVFIQQLPAGRFVVIDEIVTESTDAYMFSALIKEKCIKERYVLSKESYADPAGNQRAQTDSKTPFMVLDEEGIYVDPTNTNDPFIRIGAVVLAIKTIAMDGKPRLTISPKCSTLVKGFNGGYSYKRVQVSGSEIYKDTPDKNKYSHVHDALQYALVGLGLGDEQIYGTDPCTVPKVIRGLQ